MPSFSSVSDAFDNAMMGSSLSSTQTEWSDRKSWRTRLELTDAKADFIEAFYTRSR
ncbi:MAG TPA: hypothetical protein PLS29_03400 [Acidimicrobiales bacterium]|nr:hypothetical protein [Acidimicrobiales bacterium]